jgi:lysophospholipase L1-like esterase
MVAVFGASLLAGGSASASVLVIGDSLTVGDGPYLERELAGVPVDVDAQIGRPSAAGVPILRDKLRPEHDIVVFDLGTNDGPSNPGELAASLAAAGELAAGRCLVVATINRPPERGVTVAAQNRVIAQFAASTGAAVADWQGIVASDPSLLRSDGVHATPAGYALRALLVAQAIGDCLTGVSGIPAPSPDAAAAPPRPRKPAPPPKRPARIDWSVVGGWGPVAMLGASIGNAVRAAADGWAAAAGAFAGPEPEPVLGAARN